MNFMLLVGNSPAQVFSMGPRILQTVLQGHKILDAGEVRFGVLQRQVVLANGIWQLAFHFVAFRLGPRAAGNAIKQPTACVRGVETGLSASSSSSAVRRS